MGNFVVRWTVMNDSFEVLAGVRSGEREFIMGRKSEGGGDVVR